MKRTSESCIMKECESPDYVRISLAAAMTLGFVPGRFLRDAKLYCINLLLTYSGGCVARCAYCGLSRARKAAESWSERSFIRVEWPVVMLDEVILRMESGICPHVERVCVSMITNGRAREDLLLVVDKLHKCTDKMISALITPTIIDEEWLCRLRHAGADMVGIAVDAATEAIFDRLRGHGVGGPHRWDRYWRIIEAAVKIFGKYRVGVHLIVGLGETEKDMVEAFQRVHDLGARTHLFSFYPEENSSMQNHPQPPIGTYRRVQLARYLIDNDYSSFDRMKFNGNGQIIDYGVKRDTLESIITSGKPFMTSGCPGKTVEVACNRPFANCTPYQAYMGELRNYPFQPNEEDIKIIKSQLWKYSNR